MKTLTLVVSLVLTTLAMADSVPFVLQNQGFSSVSIDMLTTPLVGPTSINGGIKLLCFSFPLIPTAETFWSAVFFLNGVPSTQSGFVSTIGLGPNQDLQFAFQLPANLYHATYWRITFFQGGRYQDGQGMALVPVPELDTGLMVLSGMLGLAGAYGHRLGTFRGKKEGMKAI